MLKDGAYTVLTEKDGYQNKFKLDGGVVTLELDGFGGVIAKKNSYVYSGTYTVDTAKNEITLQTSMKNILMFMLMAHILLSKKAMCM